MGFTGQKLINMTGLGEYGFIIGNISENL